MGYRVPPDSTGRTFPFGSLGFGSSGPDAVLRRREIVEEAARLARIQGRTHVSGRVISREEVPAAWVEMGEVPCIIERLVPLAAAESAEPMSLGGELRYRAHHLPRNRVGNKTVNQPLLQHALQFHKHRESGEHGQGHREQRHQGQHRGEGQAAGGQPQMVFLKALTQRQSRVFPRESQRIAHKIIKDLLI